MTSAEPSMRPAEATASAPRTKISAPGGLIGKTPSKKARNTRRNSRRNASPAIADRRLPSVGNIPQGPAGGNKNPYETLDWGRRLETSDWGMRALLDVEAPSEMAGGAGLPAGRTATRAAREGRPERPDYHAEVLGQAALLASAKSGDAWAMEQLAISTEQLRAKTAGNYFRTDVQLRKEATQQSWCGVVRAMDRYDFRRGIAFADYCKHQVRNHVGKYRQKVTHPVRLPAHVWERRSKAGREADSESAAEEMVRLGTPADVASMVCRISSVQIADQYSEDVPAGAMAILSDECASASSVGLREVREQIERCLSALPAEEASALATRFELHSHLSESRGTLTPAERRRNQTLVASGLRRLRESFGLGDPEDLAGLGAMRRREIFGEDAI